ncbi:MAG: hypothetical protein E6Q97_06115 [Desulfurellales bacterium]|nr:MAG: hypothetical protein E6Q97_06115 [Desulfurellales bacterium]
MNYLPNDRNLVRDATLSATNIVPSRVYYRTDEVEKHGGGSVALSGDFTGDANTVIEVEVLDDAGTSRNVSQPTFTGTGNGAMTAVTAGIGVDPQEFVVTLVDLGTETRSAQTPFEGAVIVARTPGAGGNDIRISIDASGVVGTLSDSYRYSLQAPIQAGVNEYTGVHLWNWNTPYLNADGTIPDESPRIRFGDSPEVYRPYKRRVGREDVFSFSPAPMRDIPVGTPIKLVTGTYSITVTDGVTPETLPSITTLYDALAALADADLVTVQGVIVNDKKPGGQGVTDLSVRTAPYVAAIAREGTTYVESAQIGLTADADAPTETLRIVCTDISDAGSEVWSVSGDVSGQLESAKTDVAYSDGGYAFQIPLPVAAGLGVQGKITARYVRPNGGPTGTLPNFEAFKPTLGIGARNGTFVFERVARPVYCTEAGEVVGLPSPECLGLIPEGEDPMTGPSKFRRLQKLTAFVRAFIQDNTTLPPMGQATTGSAEDGDLRVVSSSVAEQDIAFVNTSAGILSACLRRLSAEDAVVDPPGWVLSTPYAIDTTVQATVAGIAYRFAVTVAGTSDATPPVWPATLDATVTDGGVTWQNVGRVPLGMWDDLLALLESDAETLAGTADKTSELAWVATTAYVAGNIINLGNDGSGRFVRCTVSGTSGATQPAWPTDIGDTIVDDSVTWEVFARDSFRTEGSRRAIPAAFYERYSSGAREILAAAEIDPDFDLTSDLSGDGCWSDIPDATEYFACITPDADYAPMFENVYYHSSKKQTIDGVESYASTKEFGIGPKIGCPELIAIGDQIIVTISNVNGVSTYQQGDEIEVSIVRAEPVALNGGQTGSDTLTWSVTGASDGVLDPYLMTATPPTYNDGGIGFVIEQGPIPYVLGDTFRFSVQAARGQWRQDGGAWSAPFAIGASQALADGLSAVFTEGASPSWVPGDRWTFAAESINGVDNLRSPSDARTTWASSTVIEIEPASADPITGIFIGDHTIPADATIILTGSDDGFATTALTINIPWRSGNIWQAVVADHAEYRLSVSTGGSINWLALIDPLHVEIRNGLSELGRVTKRMRLPGAARRAGLGVTVEHEAITQGSLDAFVAAISAACSNDQRRIGIVPNEGYPESAIVTVDADTLEITDVLQFQPRDEQHRLLSFSIDLSPIP